MSTQNQTDSSNQSTMQFNPLAQSTYNDLIGAGGKQLLGDIKNPFGNPLYQLGLGQSMKGASQGAANNQGVLQSIMKTSGMGGTAGQGFQAGQQTQMGRANQSMFSQANLGNIMSAMQRQMAATGMGMSFSPQMTGQSGTSSSTQTTSGLGTWLPQLLSSAAGMGMGALTGGMSKAMNPDSSGGGGGSFMGSTAAGTFPNGSPFSGFTPQSGLSGAPVNPFSASMFH